MLCTLPFRNPLPYLTGNHAECVAASSLPQYNESIYWQHKYSADTVIQAEILSLTLPAIMLNVFGAARSPAQCSESIYWQDNYSADMHDNT